MNEGLIERQLADVNATLRELVTRDAKLEAALNERAKSEERRADEADKKVTAAISAAAANQKRIEAGEEAFRKLSARVEKVEVAANAAHVAASNGISHMDGIANGINDHLERERLARIEREATRDRALVALVQGFDALTRQSRKSSYMVVVVMLISGFFGVVFPSIVDLYKFNVEHSREVKP